VSTGISEIGSHPVDVELHRNSGPTPAGQAFIRGLSEPEPSACLDVASATFLLLLAGFCGAI